MSGKGSAKDFTLHMIGNAHMDPVWLWPWQEGYQVAKATFRSALDLMKELPDVIFTCSSAAFHEWMEKGEPEMFREIQQRVKEGRWVVVGGWWIEPDCNLPCGESFVRQALYGQRYFKEKLGVLAETGYNIDSFGHNGMLPQILSKCGLRSYVFMRPKSNENSEIPDNVFWWESIDGSRVMCYRIPFSYATTAGDIEEAVKRDSEAIKKSPVKDGMCFYGRGDHGGGPTKENIMSILRLNKLENMPNIVFSSPNVFFRKMQQLKPSLPVFSDELQHSASGCYAVQSEVKCNNLKAENLLLTAEKMSVIAEVLFKRNYPRESLTRAWKNLLFTQFHDILAGTSIYEAYQGVYAMQGEALNRGNEELNYAVETLTSNIQTAGEGAPIIVFNPNSWPIRSPVEVEGVNADGVLLDNEGKVIPIQRIQRSAAVSSGKRQRIVFVADLPALGYRVYHNLDSKQDFECPRELKASANSLENGWLRLEIDPSTGRFSSLYDKKNGVDILKGDACVPIVLEDLSDTWSHEVTIFRTEIGAFDNAEVSLMEDGPVRAVIRVESHYGNSSMRMFVSLYRDLPYLECRTSVNWQEQNKMLKLSFPVNIEEPVATYSIPYGHIVRPCDGEEEPGQQWIDVSGQTTNTKGKKLAYGLSLCNDSKYSYDIKDSEMRLTVLRSPPYAHHIPYKLDPKLTYRYIDQGWQDFTFLLLPHAGSWQEAKTAKLAEELKARPTVVFDYAHDGVLPPSRSFIEIDKENIVANVLKKHEGSAAVILRCSETEGKTTEASIALPFLNRKWSARFKPCEIKTFLIPTKGEAKVTETDMLELLV